MENQLENQKTAACWSFLLYLTTSYKRKPIYKDTVFESNSNTYPLLNCIASEYILLSFWSIFGRSYSPLFISFTIIIKTSATLSWKPPKKYGLEEIVFLCNVDWFTALSTVFILRKLPTIRVTKTQIQTFLACWNWNMMMTRTLLSRGFFRTFLLCYLFLDVTKKLLTYWLIQSKYRWGLDITVFSLRS